MVIIYLLFVVLVHCQPQPVVTDNCLSMSANGNACLKCNEGFYLQYFLCMPCAPLCKCSTQYNYCESCTSLPYGNSSYRQLAVFNSSNSRCALCFTKLPGCMQCSHQNSCEKCSAGSYIITDSTGSHCSVTQCQNNCDICTDETQCERCIDGYYLNPNTKKCSDQSCQQNCLQCSSPSQCETCWTGFYVVSGQCQSCTDNCNTCNSTHCHECAPGYYVNGTQCTSSSFSNCVVYDGGAAQGSACMVCEPTYFALFGSCNQCVGCQYCSLQHLCQTPCYSSATPFNYACLEPFTIHEGWIILTLTTLSLLLLI